MDVHFIHVRSPYAGRHAAGHHARLARLDHRAARGHRPAHRPGRARRACRGRVRPGAAVAARLRLLCRAGRGRLGPRPHRRSLGRADAPPGLRPATSPRAATWAPSLPKRWPAKHPRGCSASTSTCSRRRWSARPPARTHRGRTCGTGRDRRHAAPAATATSSSRPPGRRRSATPCWMHPWPWRHGCSTTIPTPTTRSPVPSWKSSPPAISPGTSILDNITLYWLTGTGASAARGVLGERASRSPGGRAGSARRSGPGRLHRPSPARSSGPRATGSQKAYPTLTYFHEVDRGGHFAAWEEPELFATEIRAAFNSLR